MAKPSILLVPGSFSLPSFYDAIADPIRAAGYTIKVPHLPSTGTEPNRGRDDGKPPPTMYDDAAAVAAETVRLMGGEDGGGDVILLAHSYGGVPATQSIKGLSKAERAQRGKKGGVVALAYMTCLVPLVGQTAASGVLAELPPEQVNEVTPDENGWLYHNNISKSAALTFSDLPKEEGEAWIRRFPRHSAVCFTNELTYAGYKDVPVHYFVCEDDLTIPPRFQRAGIEMIERESGRKVRETSVRVGHCPMASQPRKVVDWILGVAEASQE